MRQLSAGDVDRKLAQIEHAGRSRRWKKRAKAKLLKDLNAQHVPGTKYLETPRGRICSKRRYPNFTAAMNALLTTWASPNPNRHETRAYPCKHCRSWHITSKPYEAPTHDRSEESPHRYRREKGQSERHRNDDPQGR